MPLAFVMINVKVGTDRDVVSELAPLEHVRRVYEVYGLYDIVAEVEADTMKEIKNTLNTKIRKLTNIMTTHTIIVQED